jgi:1-deoxy-D-xylulose-5-phosphate reductoisomerase
LHSVKNLTLLGSTGSIGKSTLDVVRHLGGQYRCHALVAGQNTAELAQQIEEFRPVAAVTATESARDQLIRDLESRSLSRSAWPDLLYGPEARLAAAVAPEVDFVMSAIVGVAGLEATYEAVRRAIPVGLANKEVLVASGDLVMAAARASGTELLPVDSEHNGAHQCLRAGKRAEARRLILTASGGPFRRKPRHEFECITPEQALNHPTWKMGPRITIDSASLMNKGFEVIEACWLFDFPADSVEVVVHPQSTIHALVEWADGSVVAQVSATDMRMPIQYAMTYPDRAEAPVPRLDWTKVRTWEFEPPDFERFPLLQLAFDAVRAGGSAGCTLNAADEIAVAAFLAGRITFPAIAEVVRETLERVPVTFPRTIAEVLDVDRVSRETASGLVLGNATETAARA